MKDKSNSSFSRTQILSFAKIGLLLLFFAPVFVLPAQSSVDVMTYNIRYDNPKDGLHQWQERKEELVAFLSDRSPDVLGIQEGLHHQVEFINGHLPNHVVVGAGRDDGQQAGEYSALFIDTTKFKIVQSGTFWLSKTPSLPSVGWDAALPRICTYAALSSEGKSILIMNTHFDHRGEKARIKSARLIARQMKKLSLESSPSIVMGDLNLPAEHKAIKRFSKRMIDPTQQFSQGHGTWCGFDKDGEIGNRIDYIFASGEVNILDYDHLDPRRSNDHRLSDHLPVVAVLSW